jgi:hypothetical protein
MLMKNVSLYLNTTGLLHNAIFKEEIYTYLNSTLGGYAGKNNKESQ